MPQYGELWYQGAYDYCLAARIFTAGDVDFDQLERPATRFEMVQILDWAVPDGEKEAIHDSASVPDVSRSSPYWGVVTRWYLAGITQGDQSGNFNGEKSITRAETAAILCRLAGLTPRV